MNLVDIISTVISEAKRRIIKVRVMGLSDIQTCDEVAPFGLDSNPIKGMVAVYAKTGEMGATVIIGYLNKNQIADVGENRLYSTDEDGVEKNFIWLKNDGNIEIGGNSDNMVRFSALETAFNDLQNQFNLHIHPASSGTTSPTISQSSGNISLAKINEIKTS